MRKIMLLDSAHSLNFFSELRSNDNAQFPNGAKRKIQDQSQLLNFLLSLTHFGIISPANKIIKYGNFILNHLK